MISGCGAGLPVPADTPREGTRAVKVSHQQLVARVINLITEAGNCIEYAKLSRLHQQLADAYSALARERG
jgi:hypothetical protein